MKKHFSVLFAALIIILSLPIGMFTLTASAEVISGECGQLGDILIWSYNTDTGVLTISGDGTMANYWGCSDIPWYDYRNSITEIVFDGKITGIGFDAFRDCSKLTSITIPDSVIYISQGAFYNCKNLASITLPDSLISIGYSAFYDTAYHKNQNNWKNGALYIGKYLIDGSGVKGSYSIPEGTLCIADNAFEYCSGLTDITIPSSVKSIGESVFADCNKLTSVTISDGVTEIWRYAFYNCDRLSSINLPNGLTYIGECAFFDCKSLTSITFPKSIRSIDTYAFAGSGLTSIYIPKNDKFDIGSYAFGGCYNLKDVYYGGSEADKNKIYISDQIEEQDDYYVYGENGNIPIFEATWHYNYIPDGGNSNLGDLNGDGKVNARDYGLLKRFCLGTYDMTEEEKAFADINGDGKINSRDYGLLKRHCLGTYNIFD